MVFKKSLGNLILVEMNGWRDNMTRSFTPKLNNVFTQICFDSFDSIGFETRYQLNLICHHGLTFCHAFGVALLADVKHCLSGFLCGTCEVHLPPICFYLFFEAFKVEIKMSQRMVFDIPCLIP